MKTWSAWWWCCVAALLACSGCAFGELSGPLKARLEQTRLEYEEAKRLVAEVEADPNASLEDKVAAWRLELAALRSYVNAEAAAGAERIAAASDTISIVLQAVIAAGAAFLGIGGTVRGAKALKMRRQRAAA